MLVVTEKWIPLQKKMNAEFVMAMVHSVKQLMEDFKRNLLQVRKIEDNWQIKKRIHSYLKFSLLEIYYKKGKLKTIDK